MCEVRYVSLRDPMAVCRLLYQFDTDSVTMIRIMTLDKS